MWLMPSPDTETIPQTNTPLHIEPSLPCWNYETVIVSQQGGLVQSRMIGGPPVGGGKRGKCGQDMSRGSRKRLMDWLQTFDHGAMSPYGLIFLRGSYAVLPPTSEEAHRGLNNFLDRLEYRLEKGVVVWRQEWGEKKGRLHFHFMIYGQTPEWSLNETREEALAEMWRESTAPYGGFIHVEAVTMPENVGRYISKYVSKTGPSKETGSPETLSGCQDATGSGEPVQGCANLLKAHILGKGVWDGRTWGIRGRENIKRKQAQTVEIERNEDNLGTVRILKTINIKTMRIMRNWIKSNHRQAVKVLAGKLGNMRRDKRVKALKRKNAFAVGQSAVKVGEDWTIPCAWRLKGKARTGFLVYKEGEFPRYTLYLSPNINYLGLMDWVAVNLL